MADFMLGCNKRVTIETRDNLPGIPAIRYMRPLVRIGGMMQDIPFGSTINPCFIKELKDVTINGTIQLDQEAIAALIAILTPALQETLKVTDAFASPQFNVLPIN